MKDSDLYQYFAMLDKAKQKILTNTEDLEKHTKLLNDMAMQAIIKRHEND